MGAPSWVYLVPCRAGLQAALDALRRQVLAAGAYISPVTWDRTGRAMVLRAGGVPAGIASWGYCGD